MVVLKHIKVLLLLVLYIPIILMIGTKAEAKDVESDITEGTITWYENLSPYIIKNDITIHKDAVLIIKPGTEIRFESTEDEKKGHSIIVNGTLTAIGIDDDKKKPILFTSSEQDKYWGSIDFTDESTPWITDEAHPSGGTGSILKYCVLEYGGNTEVKKIEDIVIGNGIIRTLSASPLISNCLIRFSKGDGVIANANDLQISNNKIHDTKKAISVIDATGGNITNNYLIQNVQGIRLYTAPGTVTVSNNTIYSKSEEVLGSCMGIDLNYTSGFIYSWEQIDGKDVENFENTDKAYPTFTVPEVTQDETLMFQLTVTDKDGLQSSNTVSIDVKWTNEEPIANAGTNKTVNEGDIVTLDASASDDPDGAIASYTWSTSYSGLENLTNFGVPFFKFKAPEVSGQTSININFVLTVTDKAGVTSKQDTVIITVKDIEEENKSPSVVIENDKSVIDDNRPKTITLSVASSNDEDGNIVLWEWNQIDIDNNRVDLNNKYSNEASFECPDVNQEGDTLFFQLTVTDDKGTKATDTIAVHIIDSETGDSANNPPTAEASINCNPCYELEEITLDALGTTASTDPDDDEEELSHDDAYMWSLLSDPAKVNFSGNNEKSIKTFKTLDITENETIDIRLIVTDIHGFKDEKVFHIDVNYTNAYPQCIPDVENINYIEGEIVVLDGSQSYDSDGEIVSYLWSQVCGSNCETVNFTNNINNLPIVNFKAPEVTEETELTFNLAVTDNGQGGNARTSYNSVHVTILPKNDPPEVDAGSCQYTIPGQTVNLTGIANDPDSIIDDNDNTILMYDDIKTIHWKHLSGPLVNIDNYDLINASFTVPDDIDPGEDEAVYNSIVLELSVTDKNDLTSKDTVTINIVNSELASRITNEDVHIPTVNITAPENVSNGDEVTLSAAKSIDEDDSSSLIITNNNFFNDDQEKKSNAISIGTHKDSNSILEMTSNNISGECNFLVYLHLVDAVETSQSSYNMTYNWWGTAIRDDVSDRITGNDIIPIDTSDHKNEPYSLYVAGEDRPDVTGAIISYPPMPDAGEDREEKTDTTIALDATETHDPDSALIYQWEQIDADKIKVDFVDSTRPVATFVVANFDDYKNDDDDDLSDEDKKLKFKVTVTDSEGFTGIDEVTITLIENDKTSGRENSGCFISTVF